MYQDDEERQPSMIKGNNQYRTNRSNPSQYGGNYRPQREGKNQYGDNSRDQIRAKQFSGNFRQALTHMVEI